MKRYSQEFYRAVEEIVEVLHWNEDGSASIRCPGEELHHSEGSPAMFWPDPPRVSCFHQSCQGAVRSANCDLAMIEGEEAIAREPTPEEIEQQQFRKKLWRLRRLARARTLPSLKPVTPEEWFVRSPVPVAQVDLEDQFRLFLGALYPQTKKFRWDRQEEPIIWTGEKDESGPDFTLNFRTVREWLKRGQPYGRQISVFSFKDEVRRNGFRRKIFTKDRLFWVLESDTLPIEKFGGVVVWMQKFSRLRAIVLTGGKSAHAYFDPPEFPFPRNPGFVLHVVWQGREVSPLEILERRMGELPGFDAACKAADRRRRRDQEQYETELKAWGRKHEALLAILEGLGCDRQMLRASLTARLPGMEREGTGRPQKLIYLDSIYEYQRV